MCGCEHHHDTNAPCTCLCESHQAIRDEMIQSRLRAKDQKEREFLAGLDDNLCDALSAARGGKYDGMTAAEHLENLIKRLREVMGDDRLRD